MNKHLKDQIMLLRFQGKTYNQIADELKCSKGTIGFHCKDIENNKNITKNNVLAKVKYDLNNLFTEEIRHQISVLYQYGLFPTELADALNLNFCEVVAFCRSIPRIDYSKMSNYEKVKRRRKKLKILGILYKGGKCQACGYDRYFEVLDFHHLDPQKKEFTISQQCNKSWKNMKHELDKCIVLCSICHRELHAEQNKTDLKPSDLKLLN